MPGLSHWQHPGFFAYFPSNSLPSSVLGDYLATGLGTLGLAWQSCPALTELEEVVTDWLRRMVGLSDAWSGVIQDTASTNTLVALLCARERTTATRRQPRRPAGGTAGADGLLLGPGAQLGRQGGAAGGLRPRQHPPCRARRGLRHAAGRAAPPDRGRHRRRQEAVRHHRHHRHHGDHRARPDRADRRHRARAWAVAACRCRDGRLRHDPARVPLDVGGRGAGGTRSSSTRTNGSASRSIARSTMCATRSIWCA